MDRHLQSPHQLAVLLKTTRKARALTQAAVAQQLGMSQNRYSELEQDAGGLTVERLIPLAQLLGLEVVLRKPEPEPAPKATPEAAGSPPPAPPAPQW